MGTKATISNLIVVAGECGSFPPSASASLCYMNSVMHMSDSTLVIQVYHEFKSLYEQGFMHKLANDCQLNLSQDPARFHRNCKTLVRKNNVNMTNFVRHPILRTYRYIKYSSYTTSRKYRRACVTIVKPLWRHQQSIVTSSERKPCECHTGTICEDRQFYRHSWVR